MLLIDRDGADWYDRDYGNFPEIELLQQHKLRPGARVFNAGANQCLQAMLLAKAVEPGGSVVAIEPNERNVRTGLLNIVNNRITNCQVLNVAVSGTSGEVLMNRSMNGRVVSSWEFGARRVNAISIDDLSEEFGAPDVLYIDIEGYECRALSGARRTLATYNPDCFVEVHVGMGLEALGGSAAELASFFPKSVYTVLYSEGQDHPFRPVSNVAGLPRRRFFLVALAEPSSEAPR
jgi:FkbM family methyltransferase